MKVLVIVDIQNDFCPGGSLAVRDGDSIIPVVNQLSNSGVFDQVVASQDWHPVGHMSFAAKYSAQPFEFVEEAGQVVWPEHCVQGTDGAEFRAGLDQKPIGMIIRKGMNAEIDSYSAFLENDKKTETGLYSFIPKFSEVFIVGIATDVCVWNTAVDANKYYKSTTVISDACAAVQPDSEGEVFEKMKALGINVVTSQQFL